jgi:dipeptidyl aminopeptidase/acylaminoacyl peptidase
LHTAASSACLAFLAALNTGAATAQATQTLSVPSLTLTTEQFLAGDASGGEPVTVTGRLRLPAGDGPFPAVVLLHGSEGPVSGPVARWEWALRPLGIATFSLDSFTGRGLVETVSDQSQLSTFAQIYDAYRAADALAANPRADPDRIAVMGFSRGGIAALYTAMAGSRPASVRSRRGSPPTWHSIRPATSNLSVSSTSPMRRSASSTAPPTTTRPPARAATTSAVSRRRGTTRS